MSPTTPTPTPCGARRLRRGASLAAAALLLAAPGAGAQAPAWSGPATVPGSAAESPQSPAIAFSAAGPGLVSWRVGITRLGTTLRGYRSERLSDAAFGARVRVDGLAAAPVTYASTRVATLRERPASATAVRLTAMLDSLTGSDGPNRVLERAARINGDPVLAGNPAGDLAAVWSQSAGDHDHLDLALRHPGHGFGPPATLRGSGHLSFPAVAYGERGDTVVAYQRSYMTSGGRTRRVIEARLRRAHHRFGAPQVLGGSRGVAWIDVAIAPGGRAYVVWSEQDAGEEANEPLAVDATVAAPSHFLFNRARELARAPVAARPQGAPRLVVDRAGDATAAWSLPTSLTSARIDSAIAPSGQVFGAPATLAPDGILQDLAGTGDGAAIAVWTGSFGPTFTPRPVQAAYRPAGMPAFGPAEDVAPPPEDPGDAAAAFDGEGRPVVAWVGRPGFRGEFPPAELRALRVAQRGG